MVLSAGCGRHVGTVLSQRPWVKEPCWSERPQRASGILPEGLPAWAYSGGLSRQDANKHVGAASLIGRAARFWRRRWGVDAPGQTCGRKRVPKLDGSRAARRTATGCARCRGYQDAGFESSVGPDAGPAEVFAEGNEQGPELLRGQRQSGADWCARGGWEAGDEVDGGQEVGLVVEAFRAGLSDAIPGRGFEFPATCLTGPYNDEQPTASPPCALQPACLCRIGTAALIGHLPAATHLVAWMACLVAFPAGPHGSGSVGWAIHEHGHVPDLNGCGVRRQTLRKRAASICSPQHPIYLLLEPITCQARIENRA